MAYTKSYGGAFGVGIPAISKHLKNIFDEGELDEEVVISILETTTLHGAIEGKTQTKSTNFYNLDAIISVGYRVNSVRATRFRIWASSVLREYMLKGFAVDDERLKQGKTIFGKDYFRELLETVRFLSNGIEDKSLYGWISISKIIKPSITISGRGTIGWTAYRNYPFFPIVRLLVLTPKENLQVRTAKS